jgi:hypothetical protein
MNINQLIQVNVSTTRGFAQLEDLGLPLVIGSQSSFPISFTDAERIRAYSSMSSFEADGFSSGTQLYDLCKSIFANGISKILVGKKITIDASYVDAIDAISVINNDFYAILIDSQIATDIKDVAGYVQGKQNLFLACSKDSSILDGSNSADISSYLKDNSLNRTELFYDSATRLDGAVAGALLSASVGKDRVAFLSNLSNITPSALSQSQFDVLKNKNCSCYTTVAGINLVIENTSSIYSSAAANRNADWFKSQIQISILNYLSKNKIPFSDAGISIVENLIIQVAVNALNYGVLSYSTKFDIASKLGILESQVSGYNALGFSLQMPSFNSISASDVASGFLGNIFFTGRLSGNIIKFAVNLNI